MARRRYEIRERYICSDGSIYHVNAHSEREKKKKIAERERKIREANPVLRKNGTRIVDVYEEWVDKYRTKASALYKRNIKSRMRTHIIPEIGTLSFSDITTEKLEGLFNDLAEEKGLSDSYIRKIRNDLSFLFKIAKRKKLTNENPLLDVEAIKGTKQKDRRAATKEEVSLLKQAAENDKRFVFFLVMLYCGLRNSEVAMLKGKNIIKIKGKFFLDVKGTKTESASRQVPIPEQLMKVLPRVSKDAYLFSPVDVEQSEKAKIIKKNRHLDSSAQSRLWKACKREMNILAGCKLYRNQLVPPFPVADDLTPYCFRHTYATVLHLNKIPMDYRQYLLGHKTYQMTIDTYTHLGLLTVYDIAENMDSDQLFSMYE